jgi:4-alpha-glucanotransferase
MGLKRSSGIILHPTSLPGPDGIGDLGLEAYRWIDFLSNSGCSLWQVLPLGPTGYGDSPYQCFSAFAGNPYLISPTLLLEDGLLTLEYLTSRPKFDSESVNFSEMMTWKNSLFEIAFERFQKSRRKNQIAEYQQFLIDQSFWLDDFALFMAIKKTQDDVSWKDWPAGLRKREPGALEKFLENNKSAINYQIFLQFLFFRQWRSVKDYANGRGISIIGDIPIFVAYDSADAWSHPEMFYLNSKGLPIVVAGVPPDYFSPTGQLWGNPLYRWNYHKKTGYSWWIKRIKSTLEQFDLIRLDHFRGFAGYWEIPAGNSTAEIGRWVKGPGVSFFKTVKHSLGSLPIIAEDLGVITPDVVSLRTMFELPGMRVFQFGFASDPSDAFLPHNYPVRCVAYTGTHDNDTTLGWYISAPEIERDLCRRYLASSGADISWDMIRAVWSSVAVIALAPMQDLLSLGTEARMNFPGKLGGNWTWRMDADALNDTLNSRLKEINYLYSRDVNSKNINLNIIVP